MFGYGTALLVMIGLFIITVGNISEVSLDIERDRNVLFRETHGGQIENVYIVKIFNKGTTERSYDLSMQGRPGLTLQLPDSRLLVGPSSKLQLPLNVQIDPAQLNGETNIPITFEVIATDDDSVIATSESRFMAPKVR